MDTYRIFSACLFVLLSMLLFSGLAAEEHNFGVTSFIPQKFTDFEWTIDGQVGFNGNRNSTSRVYPGDGDDYSDTDNGYDRQMIGLSSSASYRYETVPFFFSLDGDLTASLQNSNSQSSYYSPAYLGFTDHRYSDNPDRDYYFTLEPRLEVGRYLVSDLFIAGLMDASVRYHKQPALDSYSDYTSYGALGGDSGVSEYHRVSTVSQPMDTRAYTVDLSAMPGWGRTYEGAYAATALYMIDELRREGALAGEPSYDDMMALTEIVYQNRLKHAVDSRLRKIEALNAVLEYLHEHNLVDNSGPYGYLLIQDVWDYFPRYDRRFGYTVRAGVGYQFTYYSSGQSTFSGGYESEVNYYTDSLNVPDTQYYSDGVTDNYLHQVREDSWPYASIIAEYHRPVNMRWQWFSSAEWRYYFNTYYSWRTHRISYDDDPQWSYWEARTDYDANYLVSLFSSMRYIHNSRTSGLFSARYDFRHFNSTQHDKNMAWGGRPGNQETRELTLNASLEYRLAIPTTLQAGLSYIVTDIDKDVYSQDETDRNSYNLSLSIRHYLF